jgi:hypothetical membrane protein
VKRRRSNADRVPALVLLPAALAPLALVAGWNLAASAQTENYDNVHDTLSSLASLSASHREIMTYAFLLLGLGHLGTALLLRIARRPGRALHVLGGLATIAVAFLPEAKESGETAHFVAAAIAFAALALWPAFAGVSDGPPILRPVVMRSASGVLVLLVALFAVALAVDQLAGLAERAAAVGEALWPLIVAWMAREWDGGGGTPPDEPPDHSPEPEDERPTDWQPSPVDAPVGGRAR